MLRKTAFMTALLALVLVPVAHAACPAGQFFLDLKTGVTAGMAGVSFQAPLAPVPATAACPAAAGWKMAVLKIVVPAGCTQVNAVVEYEGLPSSWTVDLGDSPTNDGYAGDAGTTAHNAEAWILNEDLAVANAGNAPAKIDNPLVLQHLALTNAALKFAVRDQYLSWGNPFAYVQAPNNKNLFDFTDPIDPRTLYLGLNRVILGPGLRTGCGARRALVTFQ